MKSAGSVQQGTNNLQNHRGLQKKQFQLTPSPRPLPGPQEGCGAKRNAEEEENQQGAGGRTSHSRSSGKACARPRPPHGSLLLPTPQRPEALDVVWKKISARPLLKEACQMMAHGRRIGDKGEKCPIFLPLLRTTSERTSLTELAKRESSYWHICCCCC